MQNTCPCCRVQSQRQLALLRLIELHVSSYLHLGTPPDCHLLTSLQVDQAFYIFTELGDKYAQPASTLIGTALCHMHGRKWVEAEPLLMEALVKVGQNYAIVPAHLIRKRCLMQLLNLAF